MHPFVLTFVSTLLAQAVHGINFPYESIQLTSKDIGNFSALQFGNPNTTSYNPPPCKSFPGDRSWPSTSDWNLLNTTTSGALLHPAPLASVCYPGSSYNPAKCGVLVNTSFFSRAYLDDPASVLTQWPEGETCLASLNATSNCTQGGFPVYVVNVSTVKDVQAGVNFARNKNVRLIVKNTGHDFGGRSVGAGSLSIWTHHLKGFDLISNYTLGQYSGMAVRVGAGIENWELFNGMAANNVTVAGPGWSTVGVAGGWFANGGHGTLGSYYGLGSDQVLSAQVVTADGRFITADPYTNADIFFALRGGGGGTYGIVTSLIMKAYPPINTTASQLTFSVPTLSPYSPGVDDIETFWQGVNLYYKFVEKITAAGGYCWGYVYYLGNNSYYLTSSSTFPNKTAAEVYDFMQPLYDDLNGIGIDITNPTFLFSLPYASPRPASGSGPAETRYRSRLFLRDNWENEELFNRTMSVIRKSVEAGYNFHAICLSPTKEVAGWPGSDSALNPSWRRAVIHGSLVKTLPDKMTAQQAKDEDDQIQNVMKTWRDVTPGSGAYMNEGDPGEPNWQYSFFGQNYAMLLNVKEKHDPWSLFWQQTGVGNERYGVRSADGYPFSQNGRLCLVNSANQTGIVVKPKH